MKETKIARLRNLLTPFKNYIAMVNANNSGKTIPTILLDDELKNINKHSEEIWKIISEIPDDSCENNIQHILTFIEWLEENSDHTIDRGWVEDYKKILTKQI